MDYTEYTKKGLRTVAFCAGYGGLERGLESAGVGVQPVAFSEIEAYPVANLLAKMEKGTLPSAPIWSNLKTFPMAEFYGKVDLLTGGFPCQPFSSAGARKGDEDPRHLFPYFKRFAEIVKPRYLFLENVDGISTAKLKGDHWTDPEGTPVLLHVCRELERLGYRVASGCFNAEEMGAPHKRNRWFIYGELGDSSHELGQRGESERDIKGGPEEKTRMSSKFTEELANSDSCGSGQDIEQTELRAAGPIEPPTSTRVRAGQAEENKESKGRKNGLGHWPAGPGPYQHSYEEPRTINRLAKEDSTKRVDNTDKLYDGQEREVHSGVGTKNSTPGVGSTCKTTTKPELGGTINGASSGVDPVANRVERIRMCGNGVVPQTAGRAWTVLQWQVRNGKEGQAPIYKEPTERPTD